MFSIKLIAMLPCWCSEMALYIHYLAAQITEKVLNYIKLEQKEKVNKNQIQDKRNKEQIG